MKADYKIKEETIFLPEDVSNKAEELVKLLIEKKETVSTAESCTGGLIGGAITSVSGASEVFEQGFITYANSAKQKLLGVKSITLKNFGAVSVETCFEMAKGVCKKAKSNLGIAVTGIAGPGGGTEEKPVGLVYIGIAYKKKVTIFEYNFTGNREEVRRGTVVSALKHAREVIAE